MHFKPFRPGNSLLLFIRNWWALNNPRKFIIEFHRIELKNHHFIRAFFYYRNFNIRLHFDVNYYYFADLTTSTRKKSQYISLNNNLKTSHCIIGKRVQKS